MIPVMIVPTLTNAAGVLALLQSIDLPVLDVLVIDNGRHWPRNSPLDEQTLTAACGDKVSRLTILPMPGNLGVAGSWNLGVRVTPYAPWWCFVNDDCVWVPGALARLVEAADKAHVVTCPNYEAFSVSDTAVAQLGLFDEGLHPAYFEDNEYERRREAQGVSRLTITGCVSHAGSSTLKAVGGLNHLSFQVNKTRYDNETSTKKDDGWSLTRRRGLGWEPSDVRNRYKRETS